MTLVPPSFLLNICYPCLYRKNMPLRDQERLLHLGEENLLENFSTMDGRTIFAKVGMAWNEKGLGIQIEVSGKEQLPQGDESRPRASDGVTIWLDSRNSRSSHRGNRYCHQFHFLPTGGGPEHDEPFALQTKIHRALQDAPISPPSALEFRCQRRKANYLLEAFLPAQVLNGYDPEENSRLGFFYAIRDLERGEQTPGLGPEFPFWEDPSLWSTLELVR